MLFLCPPRLSVLVSAFLDILDIDSLLIIFFFLLYTYDIRYSSLATLLLQNEHDPSDPHPGSYACGFHVVPTLR